MTSESVRTKLARVVAVALAWCFSLTALSLSAPHYEAKEFSTIPVDVSWEIALSDKWDRAELAGRDFLFSYGPLGQLAYASSALIDSRPAMDRTATSQLTVLATSLTLLAVVVLVTPGLSPTARSPS